MRYSAFAGVAAFDDTPGLVTTPLQLVTECHTVSLSVTKCLNTKYCLTSSQRDLVHSRQGLWMLAGSANNG